MKYHVMYACVISLCLCVISTSLYAADNQPSQEEATIVGACMVQTFMKRKPPITQSTIEKCADATGGMVAKCLGMSEDAYYKIIKQCVTHLANTKCVADKMKVPLMTYASCNFERDSTACYKALGYTPEQVKKLSSECRV